MECLNLIPVMTWATIVVFTIACGCVLYGAYLQVRISRKLKRLNSPGFIKSDFIKSNIDSFKIPDEVKIQILNTAIGNLEMERNALQSEIEKARVKH